MLPRTAWSYVNALNDAEANGQRRIHRTDALQVPLAELQDRFTNLHQGPEEAAQAAIAAQTNGRSLGCLNGAAADVKNGMQASCRRGRLV